MSKHTPGPWFVSAETRCTVYSEDPQPIQQRRIASCANLELKREEECANARLIAAAPEMADMLRQIADALTAIEYSDDPIAEAARHADRMQTLLARIEGEQE